MAKTWFYPRVDSFSHLAPIELDDAESDGVRTLFDHAWIEARTSLRSLFGKALEMFSVAEIMADWVSRDLAIIPQEFDRNLAFVTLDYFYSRTFIPSEKTLAGWLREGTSQEKEFRAYLVRRFHDGFFVSCRTILACMGIFHLVPRRWVPEAMLVDSVRREIDRLGFCENPDIQLDLRLPVAGGQDWLRDFSLEHWNRLKAHLDAGKPWPIRLVGSGASVIGSKQVIAYGYEDHSDGTATIHICDPAPREQEHTLRVDFRPSAEGVLDSSVLAERGPVQGFFCEEYVPVRPPSSRIVRILQIVLPWWLIWFLARRIRLWRLRRKEAVLSTETERPV